jgi:citrate lyase subunit alpha/citrate CoA-transferase
MSGPVELVRNAVGRRVPTIVNGREQVPFEGVGAYRPVGTKYGPPIRSCRDYPPNGDKRVPDLRTALEQCGLRDGMVISTHHHFRNGDRVALMVLQTAADMGVKDLMWFPSASFPCHEPVIDLMDQGGFALADSLYADRVIVVTDNLVPFPCVPWQIQGNNVDCVVVVDSVGDPSKIVSGTTQITRSPDRLLIAEYVARFLADAGIMRDGFSFQAGAGGIALAFVQFLKELMQQAGVKARFVRGGSTQYLVQLLQDGLTDYILDGQTFDLAGVQSIASDARHVATSPFTSYNFHGKGNFASMVDATVLGATEVDVSFNANVVTHSDGLLLHGIGGWQNCLTAGCTILALPSFRDRIPVIVDEVTTMTGPGELIDVVVTERGIAVNPRREDLLTALRGSDLPVRPIEELKEELEVMLGGPPAKPALTDDPVAIVKWVDGTVLDTVWRVE